MLLFILFSFFTDFLRKCEQMSFRLESPASLCKNDLCQSSNFRHISCLEEDSGQIWTNVQFRNLKMWAMLPSGALVRIIASWKQQFGFNSSLGLWHLLYMCTLDRLQTLNCFYVWVCEGMCVCSDDASDGIEHNLTGKWRLAENMNWWTFLGSLTAIRACWGCTYIMADLKTSSCFRVTAVKTAGLGSLSLYQPSDLSRYPDSTSELEMLQGILSPLEFSPISPNPPPTPHMLSCSLRQWPTTEDSSQ